MLKCVLWSPPPFKTKLGDLCVFNRAMEKKVNKYKAVKALRVGESRSEETLLDIRQSIQLKHRMSLKLQPAWTQQQSKKKTKLFRLSVSSWPKVQKSFRLSISPPLFSRLSHPTRLFKPPEKKNAFPSTLFIVPCEYWDAGARNVAASDNWTSDRAAVINQCACENEGLSSGCV